MMLNKQKAFSLLELLLVLALVAVLLAFALPAWQQHQRMAGRQQAWLQLQRIGLQQEMWYLQQGTYCDDMSLLTPAPEQILYDYQVQVSATTYLLSAMAKANGPQANDSQCQRLTLASDGETKSYSKTSESWSCN
jgi:type IV pilus assembly protein PilE